MEMRVALIKYPKVTVVDQQSRSSVRPAVVLLLLVYYYYRHERKWWGDNEPRPSPYHSLRLNLAVKFT